MVYVILRCVIRDSSVHAAQNELDISVQALIICPNDQNTLWKKNGQKYCI